MFSKLGISFLLTLVLTFSLSGQEVFGIVRDAVTKQPIPFCHIIKNHNQGTVSNLEGEFSFPISKEEDTLDFKHLNYKSKQIEILQERILKVELVPEDIVIEDVAVTSSRHMAIESVLKAIRKFRKAGKRKLTSKALLVSNCNNQKDEEIEYSEFYGNLTQKKYKLDFNFKQGFVYLDSKEQAVTLNLDVVKLFMSYNLLTKNPIFLPKSVFAHKETELRNAYETRLKEVRGERLYVYTMKPVSGSSNLFTTELWIDKEINQIEKVVLALDQETTFRLNSERTGDRIDLEHLELSYSFSEARLDVLTGQLAIVNNGKVYNLNSTLLPFDYEEYFLSPLHKFVYVEPDMYQNYLSAPINEGFWNRELYKSKIAEYLLGEADSSKLSLAQLLETKYIAAQDFNHDKMEVDRLPRDDKGRNIKVTPNRNIPNTLYHVESSYYFDFNCNENFVEFDVTSMIDMDRSFLLDARPIVRGLIQETAQKLVKEATDLEYSLNAMKLKCHDKIALDIRKIYVQANRELKLLLAEGDIYQYIDWQGTEFSDKLNRRRIR